MTFAVFHINHFFGYLDCNNETKPFKMILFSDKVLHLEVNFLAKLLFDVVIGEIQLQQLFQLLAWWCVIHKRESYSKNFVSEARRPETKQRGAVHVDEIASVHKTSITGFILGTCAVIPYGNLREKFEQLILPVTQLWRQHPVNLFKRVEIFQSITLAKPKGQRGHMIAANFH